MFACGGHFPRSDSFVCKNVSKISQKFPPATNCFCNLFGSGFNHYISPSGRVLNTLLKLEFPHIVFDKIHMLLNSGSENAQVMRTLEILL